MIHMVELETRDFTFSVLVRAKSYKEAREKGTELLAKAWKKHAKQFKADLDPFDEIKCDISVYDMKMSYVYRDREEM